MNGLTPKLSGVPSQRLQLSAEVRLGEPVEQILRAAQEHHAELIVLGVHRRGLLHRGLDQATLVTLLRESPVPLLMLHGEDGEGESRN